MVRSIPVRPVLCSLLLLVLSCSPPYFPGDAVKAEFLHAWNAYKEHAWGHDALKPLSRSYRDWYGVPLLMTPVDAYDTMVLMGLDGEAARAKQLVLDSLSFDRDIEVQCFEVTIRLLGGLLSMYELDGDARILSLAEDLGRRLLPVFDSPTGMPYRYVNLRTGHVPTKIPAYGSPKGYPNAWNNPAEIGTLLLEFGVLSRHTGDPAFYEAAKRAVQEVFRRRSEIGLVGTWIDVETGEWKRTDSHVSGAIDSYYEYLYKGWLVFGDEDCRRMFVESMRAVHRFLPDTVAGSVWYGHADMSTGARTRTHTGALDAFFPGLLALSGDTGRARPVQKSLFWLWERYGIEPEVFDYAADSIVAAEYPLRPELAESAYYLFVLTGEEQYRHMGRVMLDGLIRSCRTEAGYAHLKDVRTGEQEDAMESYFLAETLKYLYLLLGPSDAVDLSSVVFTTEAHPLRRP